MNNISSKALAPSGAAGALNAGMEFPELQETETKLRGIQEQRKPIQEKLSAAESEINRVKLQTQDDLLQAKADQAKEDADKARISYEEGKRKLSEFPDPEFHPTEDNAQTLAMLFSLVATSGLLLGSSGKMSAMTSLSAMNGMLEGWRTGRADLYKREADRFNKETERRRRIREDIRKDIEDTMKLQIRDSEAAMLAKQSAISKAGTSSILGQTLMKDQYSNALNLLDSDEKIEKELFNIKKFKIEQQRKREEAIAKSQQWKTAGVDAAGNIVQVNPEGVTRVLPGVTPAKGAKGPGGAGGGELPKDEKTRNSYAARYQTIKNIEDIESLLKDPKYAKFINPSTKFTPDFINNLIDKFPELSQKLARIQAIEFEIGGKALTKTEQKILEPIYGWRGLTADALKQRIAGIKDNFQQRNQMEESYYPGLNRIKASWDKIYSGGKSSKLPAMPEPSNTVTVGGKTYSRPSNFTDQQWEDYKKAVGAE